MEVCLQNKFFLIIKVFVFHNMCILQLADAFSYSNARAQGFTRSRTLRRSGTSSTFFFMFLILNLILPLLYSRSVHQRKPKASWNRSCMQF